MDMLRGKHLLSVVFAILLISCSNDDAISNGGNNQLGTVEYEIDKIEDFTARELAVKVFGTGLWQQKSKGRSLARYDIFTITAPFSGGSVTHYPLQLWRGLSQG